MRCAGKYRLGRSGDGSPELCEQAATQAGKTLEKFLPHRLAKSLHRYFCAIPWKLNSSCPREATMPAPAHRASCSELIANLVQTDDARFHAMLFAGYSLFL